MATQEELNLLGAQTEAMMQKLEYMIAHAHNNPGLLLASLVMEANQEGVEIGNRACECMAWAFQNYLANHPEGPNFLEVRLTGGDHLPIIVTIQRPLGKTPATLLNEAKAEIVELKHRLEAYENPRT